jgi:hypothetical protein
MYARRTPSSGSEGTARKRRRPGGSEPVLAASAYRPELTPLELTLVADVVTFVDDAAGRWQHERGRVRDRSAQVGIYASIAHTAVPGPERGMATLTLTVFFLGTTPPETITMHGRYGADSDRQAGTVSAASAQHADRVGRAFVRAGDTVVVD